MNAMKTKHRGVFKGGGIWGLGPPGPVKSIDLRPQWGLSPPRQISEYAPTYIDPFN